ncbi:hypothetical protein I350_06913 [Cryptococcus amylolentus CBS 6273]|uniref:Uncharacterized protein n=1 Tax=Cryptococcus amylolentus CBS 6273 TaxID=1296118 RepID=A0A1E3JHH3_9TREE|nr:hypothetical protein I350_06913 [Cryptococcus amylolentus CBS 6273]
MGIISQLRSLRPSPPPPGNPPTPPLSSRSSPLSSRPSRPRLIRQDSSPSPSPTPSPLKRSVRTTEISQPTLLFSPNYTPPVSDVKPKPLYPEHRNKLHKAKSAGILNNLPRTPPDKEENGKAGWRGRARSAETESKGKPTLPFTSISDTPPRLPTLGLRKSPSTPLIRRKPPPTLSPEENKMMGRGGGEKGWGLISVEECGGCDGDEGESRENGKEPGNGYGGGYGKRTVKRGLTAPPPLLEVSTPLGTTFCLNSPEDPLIVRLAKPPSHGRTHLSPSSAGAPLAFPTTPQSASRRPLPPLPPLPQEHCKDTAAERRRVEVAQGRKGWEPPQKWDQKVFVPPPEPVPVPPYLKPFRLQGGARPRKVHTRTVSN